jgi:putative SOS response-associated peptidase YedK
MTLAEPDWEAIRALLEAEPDAGEAAAHRPRYNVAPSQPHPILLVDGERHRRLRRASWGFAPVDGRPLINARRSSTRAPRRWPSARASPAPAAASSPPTASSSGAPSSPTGSIAPTARCS